MATEVDVDSARTVLTHDFRRDPLDGRHQLREQLGFGIQQRLDPLDHEMSRSVRMCRPGSDGFGIRPNFGGILAGRRVRVNSLGSLSIDSIQCPTGGRLESPIRFACGDSTQGAE